MRVTNEIRSVDRREGKGSEIKDLPLREAILKLAVMCKSPLIDDLRSQIVDERGQFPIYFMFHSQQLDSRGRVVATRPGTLSLEDEDAESAVRAEMYRRAIWFQELYAQGVILPAIHQINLDHRIREQDLHEFVMHNPFVPPGHELIFARGLYAGLTGDFMVASALLVPQIENSLRYILDQHGVITSNLKSDGTQPDFLLGKLLFEVNELLQILGEDILFDLQGLLAHEFGSNLRNRFAHGMANAAEFLSLRAVYAWSLVLRLCSYPILASMETEKSEGATSTTLSVKQE
ncbi:MAG: DUF4209 domain-containing protein [Chloroflexota bacterium]